MTVAAAWVRTVGSCEELVFTSDSRLSGGARTFDYCAKILSLPRSDCAIAFAGYTGDAYPLMHQLALAIEAFHPLRSRTMDIRELRTHAIKIFDSMASSIESDFASERTPKDVSFLFGGYSWVEKCFYLWTIQYSEIRRGFVAHPARTLLTNRKAGKVFLGKSTSAERSGSRMLGQIAFAGDQGDEAKKRLLSMMTERYQANPSLFDEGALDFEPFETVCGMLRDPAKADSIGGAPQLLKAYQHLNTQPIAVFWPSAKDGQIYLQGRPLLGYENIDSWTIDPDTLRTTHRRYSKAAAPAGSPSRSADIQLSAPASTEDPQ
jgi:hypothetical protein